MRHAATSLTLALLLAATLIAAPARAHDDKPLPAKYLEYARPGEVVIVKPEAVPSDIKIGDTFDLVDLDEKKITGTGKVVGTVREGSDSGPIKGWRIQVDSVKK